jgi:hypothetical protein
VRSCGLDTSGCGQGPVMDPCEYSNGRLGSRKGEKFLD